MHGGSAGPGLLSPGLVSGPPTAAVGGSGVKLQGLSNTGRQADGADGPPEAGLFAGIMLPLEAPPESVMSQPTGNASSGAHTVPIPNTNIKPTLTDETGESLPIDMAVEATEAESAKEAAFLQRVLTQLPPARGEQAGRLPMVAGGEALPAMAAEPLGELPELTAAVRQAMQRLEPTAAATQPIFTDGVTPTNAADMPAVEARPTGLAAALSALPAAPAGAASSAPAQANVPSFVTPGHPAQIAEQVQWSVNQGLKQIELRLHPEKLGRVDIHIRLDGDQVNLQVVTGTAGGREAMEGGLHRLRDMLAEQGLNLAQSDISHSGGRERQGDAEAPATHRAATADVMTAGDAANTDLAGATPAAGLTLNRGLLDTFA